MCVVTEAKDWLLLTLRFQHEPIRIQKTLFLFGEQAKLPKRQKYKFRPYHWGPFSEQIYEDMDSLIENGLVERVPQPGVSWATYRLTRKGKKTIPAYAKRVASSALEELRRISEWVDERDFGNLLKDVYVDYPKMAEKSLFR